MDKNSPERLQTPMISLSISFIMQEGYYLLEKSPVKKVVYLTWHRHVRGAKRDQFHFTLMGGVFFVFFCIGEGVLSTMGYFLMISQLINEDDPD